MEELNSTDVNLFNELQLFEEYENEEFVRIPASPGDPVFGPADAHVNLVVFSDFQCSGCRTVSERIKTLSGKFRKELKVVYKHYPLSSKCNSSSQRDLHPHACQAAFAADAANRQGKFWEYHDLLFSSRIYGEEQQFLGFAKNLGLDISKFKEDMDSVSKEKVAEDLDLGHEIGISGTPTVYINGRQVKDLSVKSLEWLIETIHAIKKNQSSN